MSGELVRLHPGARRRVVVAFKLRREAMGRLVEQLGDGIEIVDIKDSQGDEDIVLVPSSSRQLIGKLRAVFPDATVLVVEVEDFERGVRLGGQVLRSLEAGADGYVIARSIDELASIVDQSAERLDSAAVDQGPAALASAAPDELSDVLDALLRGRARTENARGS